MNKAIELLPRLSQKTFLVVGDMILDRYRFLAPKRLSPEAPVIVFKPNREEVRPGGAGNAANNLAAMGASMVHLCSVVGEDFRRGYKDPRDEPVGGQLSFFKDAHGRQACQNNLVISSSRKTTIKERLITTRQQVARIDCQEEAPISEEDAISLLDVALPLLLECDVLVLSDYAHGVMLPNVAEVLVERARLLHKPIVVDTKARDSLLKYRGASAILPNHLEARDMTGLSEFEDEDIARFILKKAAVDLVGMKCGPRGILLVTRERTEWFPAFGDPQDVIDVTGAGDTVTAAVAAGMSVGMSCEETMELAQVAAGIVIRKQGTATASQEEIIKKIKEMPRDG